MFTSPHRHREEQGRLPLEAPSRTQPFVPCPTEPQQEPRQGTRQTREWVYERKNVNVMFNKGENGWEKKHKFV